MQCNGILNLQWVYGLVTFLYPGGSLDLRRASLPWHVVLGMMIYILAVGNSALGFLEKLTFLESSGVAKYGPEAFLVNFTAITTLIFALFVILSVISQPKPQDDDHAAYSAIWCMLSTFFFFFFYTLRKERHVNNFQFLFFYPKLNTRALIPPLLNFLCLLHLHLYYLFYFLITRKQIVN